MSHLLYNNQKSNLYSSKLWSASPTPLNENYRVDLGSVRRMVRHHIKYSIDGIFLAGNTGEGPYILREDLYKLVKATVSEASDKINIAVQVSDNSSLRILKNIDQAYNAGADIAVIAEPFYLRNATMRNYYNLYYNTFERSSLPICIYHLGDNATIPMAPQLFKDICEHDQVKIIKDSSSDPERRKIALNIKKNRRNLLLLNGNEFLCKEYAESGYDGIMFGGCIFNIKYTRAILEAVKNENTKKAANLNKTLCELNWAVYGQNIEYSLSGLKYLLTQLNLFKTWNNFSNYPLPIKQKKTIKNLIKKGVLFSN